VAGPLTSARPLVVEFVGLPGVGKSHATRLVAKALAAAGTPVRSAALRVNHELGAFQRVVYKSSLAVSEIVRSPVDALRVGRALIRSGQENPFDVVRLSYNWFFLLGLSRRARSRAAVELLDEGIVQQLWSIGFAGGERAIRECSATLLRGSAGAHAIPDVVVVVEAPLEVIESRLVTRRSGAGRVDRMDAADHHAALLRGNEVFAELLSDDLAPTRGGSPALVRRIRSGDATVFGADVEALAHELAAMAA
jgi:hypothetical protein